MNASALVRSPLKTSGSSPIGRASWARGTVRMLAGSLGPGRLGSPPGGGPPGGPGAGSPPPPPPSPSPPPPGGPPLPSYGLHWVGWLLSPSSVRLKALSKVVASFSCTSVLVWVTMVGGVYFFENRSVHAWFGGGRFSWETAGVFLIWSSRAF